MGHALFEGHRERDREFSGSETVGYQWGYMGSSDGTQESFAVQITCFAHVCPHFRVMCNCLF